MADAPRDQNNVPAMLFVGSDGITYPLEGDKLTGRIYTDSAGGYTNLTQFVSQTPWRVFYSDGSGDVTELAFGADGTFLKSNGAAAAPTFAVPAGSGDVSKVGTPADTQIGVWTGDGTIAGYPDFTYLDGIDFTLANMPYAFIGDTGAAYLEVDGANTKITAAATSVFIGTGLAAGTLLSNGDFDLVLKTGNTTTGNITIVDGADGAIKLDPNGAGSVGVNTPSPSAKLEVTVDDTDGQNGLTINYNDVTNDQYPIEINNAGGGTELYIRRTDAGSIGPEITLYHDSATPAANDIVGAIYFKGEDSGGGNNSYAMLKGVIVDPTAISEDGKAVFNVIFGGSNADSIEILRSATAGILQSSGDIDLVLQTGNATTSSITITDGANGDITLAPNGIGSVVSSKGVEINHTGGTPLAITDSTRTVNVFTGNDYVELIGSSSTASGFDMYAADNATYLQLTDKGGGAAGPSLYFQHSSATPAAADVVGLIRFDGKDSAANSQVYGAISGVITDPTSTSEDGKLVFNVTTAGANADELELTGAALYPTTNNGLNLGTSSLAFNATNTTTIELGHASDTTISRSAAGVIAVEGVVIPSISSTNTLTNKRVTLRTGTTTSSATPTINTDNVDFYSLTAQAADITSFTTNLSGTPTEGQKLQIAITGTAARAITWGASFEASTVALPTTTVTTNRLDVGFIWNTVTNKWRCIASA